MIVVRENAVPRTTVHYERVQCIGKILEMSKESDQKLIDSGEWVLADSFLVSNHTKPPMPPKVGQRVGEWTILGAWVSKFGYLKAYKCQCSCGMINEMVRVQHLKFNSSTCCKICINRNRVRTRTPGLTHKAILKYGEEKGKHLVSIAGNAQGRADHRTKQGMERDKTICKEWDDNPLAFIDYIATLPEVYDKTLVMDRTDNNRPYEPGNIRFVTFTENCRNTNNALFVEYEGQTIRLMDFIQNVFGYKLKKEAGGVYGACKARVHRKYSGEQMIEYVVKRNYVWPSLADWRAFKKQYYGL